MNPDFFKDNYEFAKAIEGIIVGTRYRIAFNMFNKPSVSHYYYGVVEGFSGNRYKIFILDIQRSQHVDRNMCQEVNKIEELLYF